MLRTGSLLKSGMVALLLGFPAMLAVPSPAFSTETEVPAALNPIEDFNKQLEDVKKSFDTLSGKIEQSTKDIEQLTTTDAARKDIAALQGLIADTLGAVSDNGQVAKLGQKTLDYARAKQKQFETDTKYSPEERQFLLNEWKRIGTETERATNDLANARREFTGLLRMVQTRGDYIEELQALNNAQKMLEVIKLLAGEIRSASGAMKSFIHTVTPPGAGT